MSDSPVSGSAYGPSIGAMAAQEDQLVALVALLQQVGARWADITTEVLLQGDALAVMRAQRDASATLFDPSGGLDLALSKARSAIEEWRRDDIGVHSLLGDSYPAQLRDVHQIPPLLFSRGLLVDDRRAVAVVGTRKASPRGLQIAGRIATALAEDGVTVVSGLASGIDTAAHTAALRAGGRTVAVIGTGIKRCYPAENRALQQRIAEEGLVVSQFWPDSSPTKQSFPMRNAVMSGYSAATVVVEAAYRSGARMQARLALEHGRPVVLPEELLVHDWAQSYAERPGVYVVSSPEELLRVVEQLMRAVPSDIDSIEEMPIFVQH